MPREPLLELRHVSLLISRLIHAMDADHFAALVKHGLGDDSAMRLAAARQRGDDVPACRFAGPADGRQAGLDLFPASLVDRLFERFKGSDPVGPVAAI